MLFFIHNRRLTRVLVLVSLTIILAGVGVALFRLIQPEAVTAAWYSGSWSKRKKITIDHTKVSGSADLTDFTVLISLTDTNLRDLAQPDGDDILFTSADGTTKLSHELELYQSATGQLVAWVKVPTLSVAADTILYLYYGNSTVSNQESVAASWDSNYAGVYHFAEVPQNGVQTQLNSENNTNQGQTQGSWTAGDQVPGKIGNALDFDAGTENDRVELVDNHSGNQITLSGWVKADTINTGGWQTLFQRTDSGGTWFDFQLYIQADDSSPADRPVIRIDADNDNANDANEEADGGITLSAGTWYYLAATYDGTNIRFYRDGALIESTPCNACTIPDSNNNIYVGENSIWDEDTDGIIDEVRVSSTYRSTDWIATEYNNQNSPETFIAYGTEEDRTATATAGEGPILYWNMDRNEGTTVDDASGNGNGGTRTNAVWQPADRCPSGSCLYFDGSGDYVSRAADADLNFAAGDSVSFGGWFRHAPVTSGTLVIMARHHTTGSDGGFKLLMESDGDITCGFDRDSTFSPEDAVTSTAATYDDNRWHHVMCVKSGTASLTLYIDGVSVGTPDTSLAATGTYANADTFYVGIDGDGSSNAYTGYLDDIKVYAYARTAAQVMADFAGIGTVRGAAAAAGQGVQDTLSDGLIGYWPMDEPSWTNNCSSAAVVDASGNGNHGSSCPNGSGPTGSALGKYGFGGSFNGTSQYIHVANSTSLNITGDSISLAAWVYLPSISDHSGIISKSGYNDGYRILINSTRHVVFQLTGQTYNLTTVETISLGQWHHVVGTYDGQTMRVYIDGVPSVTETQRTGNIATTTNDLDLGRGDQDDPYYYFPGSLDEIRIYNRGLSATEVRQLYAWAPGPITYLDFDHVSGTTVYDQGTAGHNGTIAGSVPLDNGKYGKGLRKYQNDSTNYVTLGDADDFSVNTTGAFTAMAWVKVDHDDWNYVFAKRQGANYEWDLKVNGAFGGQVSAHMMQSDSTTHLLAEDLTYPITKGTWYHMAMVADTNGTLLRLYVNGQRVAEDTSAVGSYDNGNAELLIGAGQDGAGFNGGIDEVKIYNYVRSDQQITEDMNGGHPIGGSPVGSQAVNYSFDELQGQTSHNNGNGGSAIDGTLGVDGTAASDDPGWTNEADCKLNGCLSFDGSNDFVKLPDTTAVRMNQANSMTFTAWVKPETISGSDNIFRYDDADTTDGDNPSPRSYYYLRLNNGTPQFSFGPSDGTTTGITAPSALTPGTWYHVAAVRDVANDVAKLYVNGREVQSGSDLTTGSWETTGQYPMIGGYSGEYFDGWIDDAKIYTAALTSAQIQLDMNANAATSYAVLGAAENAQIVDGAGNPPVAWWKFDENTGSSAQDATGHGNTASLTRTAWTRGKSGAALDFNGVNSAVTVADNPLFTPAALTVSAWVKYHQLASVKGEDEWLVTHDHSDTPYDTFLIYLQESNDTFAVTMNNTVPSGTYLQGTTVVVPEQWYHVGFVYDGSTVRLFVNGQQEGSANFSGTIFNGDGSLAIGSEVGGFGGVTSGAIDDVKIYNYARSAAQFAYDFNEGAPSHWYKLDECTGTTAYNAALGANGQAAGRNGTIVPGSAPNSSAGSCSSGTASEMWNDGTSGKFNGSLGFDGSDDYVAVNSPGLPTGDFTYSVWFYHDVNSSDTILWAGDGAGGNEIRIDRPANTEVRFRINNGTGCSGGTVPSLNQWHHVAFTRSGSAITGYLDGHQYCTGSSSTVLNFGSCPLLIGADDSSASCDLSGVNEVWAGKIDDLRIFSYPLSETQVRTVMNENGVARFGPGAGAP